MSASTDDVLQVLAEFGPSPAVRVRTRLEVAGYDVDEAHVVELLDELVAAGTVLADEIRGKNTITGGATRFVRYRVARST